MTGLLNAIRLDHRIVRARYPMLLLLLAIGVVVGVLSESPLVTIVLVTLISAPMGGTYFAAVEAGHLDHLYGTLPLKRSAVEAGIYIHSAALIAVNGLLASLAAWIMSVAQGLGVSGWSIVVALALAFAATCLYIGLLYPVYMTVSFSKVYILTNVPFYVVAVAIVFIAKRTDWFTRLAPVTDFYHDHPGWASMLTVAASVALLAISWSTGHALALAQRRRATPVRPLAHLSPRS